MSQGSNQSLASVTGMDTHNQIFTRVGLLQVKFKFYKFLSNFFIFQGLDSFFLYILILMAK